jgi:hypothetical protein
MEFVIMLLLIATLILTGYILYKVLRHPLKTLKGLSALLCLAVLGCVAWLSIIYFTTNIL